MSKRNVLFRPAALIEVLIVTSTIILSDVATCSFGSLLETNKKSIPPTRDGKTIEPSPYFFRLSVTERPRPTLSLVWPIDQTNAISVSSLCHVLLLYGLGPTDLAMLPDGQTALNILTQENTAIQRLGKSPFIVTRQGLRYALLNDPAFHAQVGELHRDQCLATFATLGLPINTPIRLTSGLYTISNLVSESAANFSLQQSELAWTTIALAKYLPPTSRWANKFSEPASFSLLSRFLMTLDLKTQSCGGTHILQALLAIDEADDRHKILDSAVRKQLELFLAKTLIEAVNLQRDDGSWGIPWCKADQAPGASSQTPFKTRILVTGHLLETFCAHEHRHPMAISVYERAARWLDQALKSSDIGPDVALICPVTHAAKSINAFKRNAAAIQSGFADETIQLGKTAEQLPLAK